jgi:antirestriction protein ArdC
LRWEGLIMASSDRADVYTRITNEIIAAIENGPGDWQAPWHHDGSSIARPINLSSAKRYRGINTVTLWVAAMNNGYVDGLWGTYRQWAAVGAQVRKGERATTVVFWKQIEAGDDGVPDDDEDGRMKMFARAFSVFNVAQVDGFVPASVVTLSESERDPHAGLRLFPGCGVILWGLVARTWARLGSKTSP